LRDGIRARVLAADVEPGLIDAYVGEDLFVDTHRALIDEGFWLSNLDVRGVARLNQSILKTLPGLDSIARNRLAQTHRITPGWCEARYLRRVDALEPCERRDYLLLSVLALMDYQYGYAQEVLNAYRSRFSSDADVSAANDVLAAALQHHLRGHRTSVIEQVKRVGRPIKRFAHRLLRR
jgi:hypothetical protein